MYSKNETSNLPYSFEEVDQLGLETYNLMQRDAAEFSVFGIDQVKMDSFKALSDSFNKRDFDEQFLLVQKEKTFAKDEMVKEIRTELFNLATKVEWLTKLKGISYTMLKLGALSNDNSHELATKAKVCIRVLTDKYEEFSDLGISLEYLDSLSIKIDELRIAIDSQSFAEHNRHIAQSKRLSLANELFAEISKYRALGRRIWATKNFELAKTYVLPKKHSALSGSDPEPEEPVESKSTGLENNS